MFLSCFMRLITFGGQLIPSPQEAIVFEIENFLLTLYAKCKYTESGNRGRLPEQAGEVACVCGRQTMSSQSCCLLPFRGHGNQRSSQPLKENNCYDPLQEEQKSRSSSASSQFLWRPWKKPFSKPFLATLRAR